jgi:cob(I)alamin adenosyltransferase
MKIYTRKGDDGSTGLYGGLRISKADLRVGAYGTVDETNAVVGWARAAAAPEEIDAILARVQETCFRIGAWLSAAPGTDPGVGPITRDDVDGLEEAIDRFEADLPPLKNFVVPGGSELASRLHIARTVSRRAERLAAGLGQVEPVAPTILQWMNRLSDLLFVLARAANQAAGIPDRPWVPRVQGQGES